MPKMEILKTHFFCLRKRRIAFLFAFSLISQFNASAQIISVQDSILAFTDSTFELFKNYSLYAEKINWEKRKKDFLKRNSQLPHFKEIFPAFQTILDDLGDHHSFFWYNNTKYSSRYGQLDASQIRKPLMDALENGHATLTVDVIDSVGYIRIPPNNSPDDFNEMQKSAQEIQDSICTIYSNSIKGWIIDLRLNTGGNMYPMIAGIQSFLKPGTFASTVDRNDSLKDWAVDRKAIYEGNKKITELKENCLPVLSSAKTVVLISQVTGSSGEITALAFINRPNTYFIGEKTAGFMTSNELFRLPFNTFLLLTSAYETDSNGKIISFIQPDKEMVDGDDFDTIGNDLKVLEAFKWINK